MEAAPRSRALGRSGPRTRNGCLTCRQRKVRCDQASARVEERRHCDNCARLALDCRYADGNRQGHRPRPTSRHATPARQSIDAAPQEVTHGRPNAPQHSRRRNQQHVQAEDLSSAGSAPHMSLTGDAAEDKVTWNNTHLLPVERENMSFASADIDWTQPPFSFDSSAPWDSIFSVPVPEPGDSYVGLPHTSASTVDEASTRHERRNEGAASDLPSRGLDSYHQAKTVSGRLRPPRTRANVFGDELGQEQDDVEDQVPRASVGSIDLSLFNVTQHQRCLLLHFSSKANCLPLISPTHLQWRSPYTSLTSMACGCFYLINAICAVSELSLVKTGQGSIARALKFYEAAHAKMEAILWSTPNANSDLSLKQAFATLLLLMQTEIFAPSLAAEHNWPRSTLQCAHRHLKRHGETMRRWTGLGSHLLTWIQLVDSKAVYAAGMDKYDRALATGDLEIAANPLNPADSYSTATEGANPSLTSPVASKASAHLEGPPELSERLRSDDDDRPDFQDDAAPVSAAEIAYDALYQPAYQFFVRCHCVIPRIIALDLHHRRRGPLDAEIEVLQVGQRLRTDLSELWHSRPRELSIIDDANGLEQVLHPSVAEKIVRNFRGFVANFYAITILLHRVAFTHFPASSEVHEAVKEILRLGNEQVSSAQPFRTEGPNISSGDESVSSYTGPRKRDADAFVGDDERTVRGSADAGGTPLPASHHFEDSEQRQGQMSVDPARGIRGEECGGTMSTASNACEELQLGAQISDALQVGPCAQRPSSELGPGNLWLWPLFMAGTECAVAERPVIMDKITSMGSRDAQRTAKLLAELTKCQDEQKVRIDQRSIRQRIFADELDLVC